MDQEARTVQVGTDSVTAIDGGAAWVVVGDYRSDLHGEIWDDHEAWGREFERTIQKARWKMRLDPIRAPLRLRWRRLKLRLDQADLPEVDASIDTSTLLGATVLIVAIIQLLIG